MQRKIPQFHSTLSGAYWRSAAAQFKSLRIIVFAALMIALRIVIGMVYLPVGENLRMLFKFIPDCISALVCGPLVGLCIGGLGDLLGFFIFPTGPFFPGYTISAMLTCLVFALFLYRRPVTYVRLFLSRLVINLFVNTVLGSVWSLMLYGKGFIYYAAKSIVKNIVLLPVEVVILIIVFTLLLPVLKLLELVPKQDKVSVIYKTPRP